MDKLSTFNTSPRIHNSVQSRRAQLSQLRYCPWRWSNSLHGRETGRCSDATHVPLVTGQLEESSHAPACAPATIRIYVLKNCIKHHH